MNGTKFLKILEWGGFIFILILLFGSIISPNNFDLYSNLFRILFTMGVSVTIIAFVVRKLILKGR